MGVSYELRTAGIDPAHGITSSLVEVSEQEAQQAILPVVQAMTPQEFCDLKSDDCGSLAELQEMESAETNFVDVYPNYLIGSFAIPSRTSQDPTTFAFYMNKQKLVFIDTGEDAEDILKKMVDGEVVRSMSTAHCLYYFMKSLVLDDLHFMEKIEDDLEDLEEGIADQTRGVNTSEIMKYRRLTLRLVTYYQQIATMASILSDNENKLMSHNEARQFDQMSTLADRLSSRAETIRDYSLQLHELQQTYIDLKQNSIMQIFTIVTVLFAPLTLVTGWFGMNLQNLPGTGFSEMWFTLVVLFVVCTGLLLYYFHRKKWL